MSRRSLHQRLRALRDSTRARSSFALAFVGSLAAAQAGTVESEQKVSETTGGFGGVLDPSDQLGFSLAGLGDLDGDGIEDLAAGARFDDDGGTDQGAVWILFLNADGTVASEQKIGDSAGGFAGNLDPGDNFGCSVAALGDLDGDGIVDLAVGASRDDDGGTDQGAVWILFMNANGTVSSLQKISETGGFGGNLDPGDQFGFSVTGLGDLDGDGNEDLAVGAPQDDDGGTDQGAVWILFMNAAGTVASRQKISETTGGFSGVLDAGDGFGVSVAGLGDLDGNGREDVAVGARGDDDGGTDQGAVWILFLSGSGTVAFARKVNETSGGFGGALDAGDEFGFSVAALDDLDGDGNQDLAVGAYLDDDGGPNQGAVWILFLNWDGTVASEQKISEISGGFAGVLDTSDQFGISVAALGDLDGDGNGDLAVGAYLDDDGGADQGAVWNLFLEGPDTLRHRKLPPAAIPPTPVTLPGPVVIPSVAGAAGPRTAAEIMRPGVDESHGSGGLRARGVARVRNGSDVNEACLSAGAPLAGADWEAWVDVSAHPNARASVLLVSARALAGTASTFGEVLVDLSSEPLFTSLVPSRGGTDVHTFSIPFELLGATVSLQALILDEEGRALTNAIDLVVGQEP